MIDTKDVEDSLNEGKSIDVSNKKREENMDNVRKFQWSKFSPDKSEQWVVRSDSWNEISDYRDHILELVPKPGFPEDSGSSAHVGPTSVNPTAPMCGVHNVPMVFKGPGISRSTGRSYPGFWSCGEKNPDGSYCNFRPKK